MMRVCSSYTGLRQCIRVTKNRLEDGLQKPVSHTYMLKNRCLTPTDFNVITLEIDCCSTSESQSLYQTLIGISPPGMVTPPLPWAACSNGRPLIQ